MTRLLLIACLAASAGVHLALAPVHGGSFHVAAALLASASGALALRPGRAAASAASLLLAVLLTAFIVAGEGLDLVAASTKAIEGAGLLLSVQLARAEPGRRPQRALTLAAATLIALFAASITPSAGYEHRTGATPHAH